MCVVWSLPLVGVGVDRGEVDAGDEVVGDEVGADGVAAGVKLVRAVRRGLAVEAFEPDLHHMVGIHGLDVAGHLRDPRLQSLPGEVALAARLVHELPREDGGVVLVRHSGDLVHASEDCLCMWTHTQRENGASIRRLQLINASADDYLHVMD